MTTTERRAQVRIEDRLSQVGSDYQAPSGSVDLTVDDIQIIQLLLVTCLRPGVGRGVQLCLSREYGLCYAPVKKAISPARGVSYLGRSLRGTETSREAAVTYTASSGRQLRCR